MSTLHPLIHPTRLQYIYSMRPENCLESLESLLDFNRNNQPFYAATGFAEKQYLRRVQSPTVSLCLYP